MSADIWSKNLFLTASPLLSLQLPFQRKSTSSIKNQNFQNQKDDNKESDVSQFVFMNQSVSSQNHRMYPDVVCLFSFLITTLQQQQKTVTKVRMYIFAFCLKHGEVYYLLFLFQWTDSLTQMSTILIFVCYFLKHNHKCGNCQTKPCSFPAVSLSTKPLILLWCFHVRLI